MIQSMSGTKEFLEVDRIGNPENACLEIGDHVNSYEMPLGIFVGMNNHGKTILFGCALLRNETTSAFRWLMMKTFISLMKNPPKTILTDQDPWMAEAIPKDLSSTKHSFCIWQINYFQV
ncbi:Protein FAR1-RELATED SEQUENCE 11 [Glycine soja]|nr:Protein FAR1-RELATED SEQUENCE 11 [Glycine soja]